MIAPKVEDTRTKAQIQRDENEAYELCGLRDLNRCVRCGAHDHLGLNRDHRKNRSQGGRTVIENLQLLCGTGTTGCHGWVTEHPRSAVLEGFAIPGWPQADPAEWPARRVFSFDVVTGKPIIDPCMYRADGSVDWISVGEYDERLRALGIPGVN